MPEPNGSERSIKVLLYKIRWKDAAGADQLEVAQFGVTRDMAEAFSEMPDQIPGLIEAFAHELIGDYQRRQELTFELFERKGHGMRSSYHPVSPATLKRIPSPNQPAT